MRTPELDHLLHVTLTPGLGPIRATKLIDMLGSAEAVIGASEDDLRRVDGIGPKLASHIRRGLDEVNIEHEWELIDRHGVTLLSRDDPAYPPFLKRIYDPPMLLYVRGRILETDCVALGVVGSRKCTVYGREQSERLASYCAQAGLTIISGGAYGIDSAAHRATVRVKGRTVAVLGSGLSKPYPSENADLFDQIADGQGAVISELPMAVTAHSDNFPRRNRIISGMSLGVLVIEARDRSGALITARLAVDEHHREVMAVPGRIDSEASAGCHRIIREGWAVLVTCGQDILDALQETGQSLTASLEAADETHDHAEPESTIDVRALDLNDDQQTLLNAVGDTPVSLDELCGITSLGIATIQSQLTILEIRGLLQRVPGNLVRRKPK